MQNMPLLHIVLCVLQTVKYKKNTMTSVSQRSTDKLNFTEQLNYWTFSLWLQSCRCLHPVMIAAYRDVGHLAVTLSQCNTN